MTQVCDNIEDRAERITCEFLSNSRFDLIEHEPDGNVPPDFLINKSIAVEVRRLNESYFKYEKPIGLEQKAIPLWKQVSDLVKSYGASKGESWFVFYSFSRPLDKWKNLKPKIMIALDRFVNLPEKRNDFLVCQDNFNLEVFQASNLHDSMFVMAGYSDYDSGGGVLSIMKENINNCVTEKTKKISNYRNKYDEWWLVLVNTMNYSLNDIDKSRFKNEIIIEHDLDKVIILNPSDFSDFFEV